MSLGFTGTRDGMTAKQKKQLSVMLDNLNQSLYRHGDCCGSDEQFHNMVREKFPWALIVIHPPNNSKFRANCKAEEGSVVILETKEYLVRNGDIVDGSDILIACPKEMKNTQRSGTWATIRYAIKKEKVVIVIFPNGTIKNGDKFIGYSFGGKNEKTKKNV